jgi:hypothetical protein
MDLCQVLMNIRVNRDTQNSKQSTGNLSTLRPAAVRVFLLILYSKSHILNFAIERLAVLLHVLDVPDLLTEAFVASSVALGNMCDANLLNTGLLLLPSISSLNPYSLT